MLEFVIPRAISKVFPPDGVALAKSRSETLAAMKAEPYAPGFSGRLEPLVDAEFATVFSGSGEFVTS